MTGDIETAGDIATGALAARIVEPHTGESSATARHGACLNCGTALIGDHCHACGQSGHVHRTAGAVGHELAHGVLHFEGKIWRTLPMLALRPGELTRRYVAGERARFVSPLALFLFTVFLMFALLSNLPGVELIKFEGPEVGLSLQRARAELADGAEKTQTRIAGLEADLVEERAAATPDRGKLLKLERGLASARNELASLSNAQRFLSAPDGGSDNLRGKPRDWLATKLQTVLKNPKLLIYKLKTSAYKYSWTLIPISLPFIWLLFPLRRDVGLYDHAIFATYSLSFMSLLVIIVAVLATIGLAGPVLGLAAMVIPVVHIYKQLKGAYGLTRHGALWRTSVMLVFTLITSTLFVLLLLFAGVSD